MSRRIKTLLITGTMSTEGFWEPGTLAEYPDELDLDCLKLTFRQMQVLHDLVEDHMDLLEREGYAGHDHHRAFTVIEKQIAAYRGRNPRTLLVEAEK